MDTTKITFNNTFLHYCHSCLTGSFLQEVQHKQWRVELWYGDVWDMVTWKETFSSAFTSRGKHVTRINLLFLCEHISKIYACNFSVFRIYHVNLSIVFLFLSGHWATNAYIWAAQCCEHEAMEYHQLVSVHLVQRRAAWVCACCNASSISTLSDHMLHPLIVLTSEMIGVAFLLQLACL